MKSAVRRAGAARRVGLPLLAGSLLLAISSTAQADPLADAPIGVLTLTVEVRGQGRHDAANGVEWHELAVARRLELTLPMVMMATAPVGFQTSPETQAVLAEQANAEPPDGFVEMQQAMDACNGDQQCLMLAGMEFARMMQEGKIEMPAPPMADNERFQHWMVDRRQVCATGRIAVDDAGQGVVISPPSPAAPFSYRRSGERRLPEALEPVIDKVCAAMIAIDTRDGSLDLAVPGFTVPVELTYTGNAFAGESGRSEIFVEGTTNGAQAGAVDLFEFPVDPEAGEMSGEREVEHLGTVTHAGGYGTTPVDATVTWRFVRD